MNTENLRKLAEFLRGPLPGRFDMAVLARVDDIGDVMPSGLRNSVGRGCGTVACALGWAPVALGLGDDDWDEVDEKALGIGEQMGEWDWIFSEFWEPIDNTATGAADRIDWLLDHGLPPNWHLQIFGTAPICYRTTTSEPTP